MAHLTMDQIDKVLLAYEHEPETRVSDIGARYGVSGTSVRYHAKRHGLAGRRQPPLETEAAHLLPVLGTIRLTSRPGVPL